MDEMSADAYLDALQKDKLLELMPVIVVMAIICVLGIVGNSFTIAFYGFVARRTPTIFLITVLACVDLVVCVLIIAQITEMAVNVKFTSAASCKIIHFLGHWTIVISTILLWFIAIDRYRHVCCPVKRQVTHTVAKRVAVVIIIFSLLTSVGYFVNFDIIEFRIDVDASNRTDVLAHYCTLRTDPTYSANATFWNSLDAFLIVIILVTLCVTYGRIVWVLKRGRNALDTGIKGERSHKYTAAKNTPAIQPSTHIDDSSFNVLEYKSEQDSGRNDHHTSTQIDQTKIRAIERSITLMMLVVSVVFFVCFLPHFIVKIGLRTYSNFSQLELTVGMQFVLRLAYVNSCANPLVFCCFNPQFRHYIRDTVLRRMHMSKKKSTCTTMSKEGPSPTSP